MSTELGIKQQPTSRASALSLMASRFSVDPEKLLSTLKNTVFKGASNDELLALVVVANEYKLNPLTKEIYAFPAKGGGIVPVVSIDGWINRMNSNDQFDGIEFADTIENGKVISTTARIWRKDRSRPIVVTEYLAECQRNTDPWKQCPARMLRHKALIQCVRVAFGFGGVFDEDEARDVIVRDVRPLGPDLSGLTKANESPGLANGSQGEPASAAAFPAHETKPTPETLEMKEGE